MEASDFVPTEQELTRLNELINQFAQTFAKEGEQPDGVQVLLSWAPGLGRSIALSYSGSRFIDVE
jgi:hypothetical protein